MPETSTPAPAARPARMTVTGIGVTDTDRDAARAYMTGMAAGTYVVVLLDAPANYRVSGRNDAMRRARQFRRTSGAPVLTVSIG